MKKLIKAIPFILGGLLFSGVAYGTITQTFQNPVPIVNGGTGATTTAQARTNLGLGTAATEATGTAEWNASQIQGKAVSSSAPSAGDVLQYDGTLWQHVATSSLGFISTSSISINGSLGNVFTGLATSTPTITTTTKSLVDPTPSSTDDYAIELNAPATFTIRQASCLNFPNSGNTVTWNVYWGSTNASSNKLFASDNVCTANSTASILTSFASSTITAGSIIRFKLSAASSTGATFEYQF